MENSVDLVLRLLIWVFNVDKCPYCGTLGLTGLSDLFIFAIDILEIAAFPKYLQLVRI